MARKRLFVVRDRAETLSLPSELEPGRVVGDADHLTLPPSKMLSDPFIAERRSHIDPKHAAQNQVAPVSVFTRQAV